MTKGDRDKLRAELAGRFVAALIVAEANRSSEWESYSERCARQLDEAVRRADGVMDRLGLSEASEQAEIAREAELRRGSMRSALEGEQRITEQWRNQP